MFRKRRTEQAPKPEEDKPDIETRRNTFKIEGMNLEDHPGVREFKDRVKGMADTILGVVDWNTNSKDVNIHEGQNSVEASVFRGYGTLRRVSADIDSVKVIIRDDFDNDAGYSTAVHVERTDQPDDEDKEVFYFETRENWGSPVVITSEPTIPKGLEGASEVLDALGPQLSRIVALGKKEEISRTA